MISHADHSLPPENSATATASLPASNEATQSFYATLLVGPKLGDMMCHELRSVLQGIGAKDIKAVPSELIGELRAASFLEVLPKADWSRTKENQRLLLATANDALEESLRTENKAAAALKILTDRRDGALRVILQALRFAPAILEREAEEIRTASIPTAEACLRVREDRATVDIRTAKTRHLNTFFETPYGMLALSRAGAQVLNDLRNEGDLTFRDFAARQSKLPTIDSLKLPPRPGLVRLAKVSRSLVKSPGTRWSEAMSLLPD